LIADGKEKITYTLYLLAANAMAWPGLSCGVRS
jgi:hypothetical protein